MNKLKENNLAQDELDYARELRKGINIHGEAFNNNLNEFAKLLVRNYGNCLSETDVRQRCYDFRVNISYHAQVVKSYNFYKD